ncbi:MAG: hypothetical protein Kow00124_13530 [Anaerolineae bacterium]
MTSSSSAPPRTIWLVLAAALILRVMVILFAFTPLLPTLFPDSGIDNSHRLELRDDEVFYHQVGSAPQRLFYLEHRFGQAVTTIGPVYPLFLAPFIALFRENLAVQLTAIRLAQALIDTAAVGLVYLIARQLFGQSVGRIALLIQALDVRYMYQAGTILTETVFIGLFLLALWLYVRAVQQQKMGLYRLAGVALALATLTRPVPVLFPALLAVHLLIAAGDRRRALAGLAWMIGMMALVMLPWQVRVGIVTGELVPVSKTGTVHLWLASREDGQALGKGTIDEARDEEIGPNVGQRDTAQGAYISTALENILSAPGRWLARIGRDTLAAYLQPYGTVIAQGSSSISAKQVVLEFLAGERAFADVLALPGLMPRLLMYIWHYAGLIGGIAGAVLVMARRQWQALPLIFWIIYGTVLSAVLLVEPRYLFPLMAAFTILAAYAADALVKALNKHTAPVPQAGG